MNEHDLAEWTRKEHDQVEQLADRLREIVSIIPRSCTESWIAETRDRFQALRSHLVKHLALVEKHRYGSAVLNRQPGLSVRVDRLEQEHRDLVCLCDDLFEVPCALAPHRPLLIRDFCARLQSLLDYVDQHENEEDDLIEFVFTQGIGTID